MDAVHDAAKKGNVVFRPSSERDSRNLGYFGDESTEVLVSLRDDDFHRTEDYSHGEVAKKCDVYLPTVENDQGSFDELYIKIQLHSGWLIVHSFHLQR